MCQLALCSKKIFGLVEQFSRNWLSLAENMFPNVSNIDTWFPYKLNFGAKIWEGGSSPSKKAGVYPCTSKIGCVQSSALVRRRDNGEHNWVQHDFHQRLGTEYDNVEDLPVGRHFTCMQNLEIC